MKTFLLDLLICPACLPEEKGLKATSFRGEKDIASGYLECPSCLRRFPIDEGVAILTCHPLPPLTESQYEQSSTTHSYLWSHYADRYGDHEAGEAYRTWATLLPEGLAITLDTGCSVGRFSFEMSRVSSLTVGIDNSVSFIRNARQLLQEGELHFPIVMEGTLTEERKIDLDPEWLKGDIEFIVADAMALPFPANRFDCTASLNLLDRVASPLLHLQEVNRVCRRQKSHLLHSSPYSWSSRCSPEAEWLGGKKTAPFAGNGPSNVTDLLQGFQDLITPPWRIKKRGSVWWKIRNHRNHFELIRSEYLFASR